MIAVKMFTVFLVCACVMYVVTTVWDSWADDDGPMDEGQ